jgi:sec-independent protein translocase protein TatB
VFNIGPMELLVLAAVALVVFGPDKLPQLSKDAARMIKTLREIAQGARTTLNSELGPEFADFDLSSLNPRTAIKNALLGDEDFSSLNPRDAISRAIRGEEDPVRSHPMDLATPEPYQAVSLDKAPFDNVGYERGPLDRSTPATSRPLEQGEQAPFDPDAT